LHARIAPNAKLRELLGDCCIPGPRVQPVAHKHRVREIAHGTNSLRLHARLRIAPRKSEQDVLGDRATEPGDGPDAMKVSAHAHALHDKRLHRRLNAVPGTSFDLGLRLSALEIALRIEPGEHITGNRILASARIAHAIDPSAAAAWPLTIA